MQRDYEVNLKAELEIMALHNNMDQLREHQWGDLMKMQKGADSDADLVCRRPEGNKAGHKKIW